jgi:hypothetical protein
MMRLASVRIRETGRTLCGPRRWSRLVPEQARFLRAESTDGAQRIANAMTRCCVACLAASTQPHNQNTDCPDVRAEFPTVALPDEFARSAAAFVRRAFAQSAVRGPESWRVEMETTFKVQQAWKESVGQQKTVRVRTVGATLLLQTDTNVARAAHCRIQAPGTCPAPGRS